MCVFGSNLSFERSGYKYVDVEGKQFGIGDWLGIWEVHHAAGFGHVTTERHQVQPTFRVDAAEHVADGDDACAAFVHGARRPRTHIAEALYGDRTSSSDLPVRCLRMARVM